MSLPLDWVQLLGVTLVLVAGASLQGAFGFGLGLITTPFLILIDPRLVPGPFLVSSLLMIALMAVREWRLAEWKSLRWITGASVGGILLGAQVLAALPPRETYLAFGFLLLVAVTLSLTGWRLPSRRRVWLAAGFLSGILQVMAGIGGPPLALVYQDESAIRIRASLSVYFCVSGSLAILALARVGEFNAASLPLTLAQLPGLLLGYSLSSGLRAWIGHHSVRPAVLAISALAGFMVIAQQLGR